MQNLLLYEHNRIKSGLENVYTMPNPIIGNFPENIFLNRAAEQELLKQALTALANSANYKYIINFCGIGGIGKTALLHFELEKLTTRQSTPHNWLFSYIDFDIKAVTPINDFHDCLF